MFVKATLLDWCDIAIRTMRTFPRVPGATLPAFLRHEADIAFGEDRLPVLPEGFRWAINGRINGAGRRVPYRIERNEESPPSV